MREMLEIGMKFAESLHTVKNAKIYSEHFDNNSGWLNALIYQNSKYLNKCSKNY